MRILVLTTAGEPLNCIRPEAELFIGLQRGGDEVTVMTGRENVYWERFAAAGINLIGFEPRRRMDLTAIHYLRKILRADRFDVVYALNNKAICNAAFAALGLPPLLVTYRGRVGNVYWYDPSSYFTHLHPRVDAISCVSNAVRDDLRRHVRQPGRVVTVYKGHDLEWYGNAPVDLGAFGIPAGAFVIGCTVNYRPHKGLLTLVEAFDCLPVEPEAHLLLVGKGLDAPKLTRQIIGSMHAARIHRVGFRTDAPEIAAACSCTVLATTQSEGLPKSVIESMAYGVPPVVTGSGGSAELVEDGVSGFLVPPGDKAALTEKMDWLATHPDERERMGQAARSRIASQFNVRDSIENTRRYFQTWLRQKH